MSTGQDGPNENLSRKKYREIDKARSAIDRIEATTKASDEIAEILRSIDRFILENSITETSIRSFLDQMLTSVVHSIDEVQWVQVAIAVNGLTGLSQQSDERTTLNFKIDPNKFDQQASEIQLLDPGVALDRASGFDDSQKIAILPIRFQRVFIGSVAAILTNPSDEAELTKVLEGIFQQLSILMSIFFEKCSSSAFTKMWDTIIDSTLSPEECFDAVLKFIPQIVPDLPGLRPKDYLIQILVADEDHLHIRATNGAERRNTPVSTEVSVAGHLIASNERSLLVDPTKPPYVNLFRDFFSSDRHGYDMPRTELVVKLEVEDEDFTSILNIECPKPNQISRMFQKIVESFATKLASLVYAFEERRSVYADWAQIETETTLRYASLISQAFEHQWAPTGAAVRMNLDLLLTRTKDRATKKLVSKAIAEHSKYTAQVADFTDGFEEMLKPDEYSLCELIDAAVAVFRGAERLRINELGKQVFRREYLVDSLIVRGGPRFWTSLQPV